MLLRNKKQYRFIATFGRRKIRVASVIRNGSMFKFVVCPGFRIPRDVFDVFALLGCYTALFGS
jgi:hypothetical protein